VWVGVDDEVHRIGRRYEGHVVDRLFHLVVVDGLAGGGPLKGGQPPPSVNWSFKILQNPPNSRSGRVAVNPSESSKANPPRSLADRKSAKFLKTW
jgi:hypothetical protein